MQAKSLLCLVAGLLLSTSGWQAQNPNLERLGAAEGLSQGMIFDILQDDWGFLWFATKDGLNRYDGYSFQVFQNNPFDQFSISDNEIQCLFQDQLGRIWAGTANNGLNVLDPATGRFYHLRQLCDQNIHCIAQTKDGAIWVGTENGVNRVQVPATLPLDLSELEPLAQIDSFYWEGRPESPQLPYNWIVDLMGAQDGKLWVSSQLNVACYDPEKNIFQIIQSTRHPGSGEYTSSYFQEAKDGTVWVGQPGRLLRIQNNEPAIFPFPEKSPFPYTSIAFNAEGKMYVSTRKQIFTLSEADQKAVPQNANFQLVYRFPIDGILGSTKLLIDRNGLLWIGTNGYGIRKFNPGNPRLHHYLPEVSPRRIYADARGRLWVWKTDATFSQLLEQENTLANLLFQSKNFFQHDCLSLADGSLWLLCEQKKGLHGNGFLFLLDDQNLYQKAQFHIPISIGAFSRMYEDKAGNLWIVGNKSSLAKFNLRQKTFETFDFSQVTGVEETAIGFHIDAQQNLWIGTPHGLLLGQWKEKNLDFTLYQSAPLNHKSLNCNYILSILDDPAQPDRYCWLGTKGGGLNFFDKQEKTFEHFTIAEGLPNNVVYGILPDEWGNLWLSTNCGLSRFDPKEAVFQNFFSVDGLQDNEFNTSSYTRSHDGRLYFGGVNGITAFYPAELRLDASSPPVLITRLKINNLTAKPGDGVLETSIEKTQRIVLSHVQNQLSFEFAAIDFAAPRMNQFRYRLLGAEKNWVEATTANSATYAHLSPGEYVFEVRTGGSRGIWDGQPARLKIVILPPWWRSNWAYALYALLLGLGVATLYRFQVKKIRLENKLRFEHRESKRLAELDRLKTNFFNGVAHEFRTPLSLLLEPLRQLLAESKDRAQRYRLELVEKNAQRLLQFVNQLLDLSKLEAGQMPLDLRAGYPEALVRAVAERFQPLASERSVRLNVALPKAKSHVLFDESKWDQILSNLLSNALKFTDKGGSVSIALEEKETPLSTQKEFRLTVSDSGIGISPKELPRVFNRFYQTDHARGGTGLGLSLTKDLVECMGGTISVESTPNVGTTFRVALTCLLANDEKPLENPPVEWATVSFSALADTREKPAGAPLVLLIEDDAELRRFLRSCLPASYRVTEAKDGVEGIQMAQKLVPDLIVSDLMMPYKTGFEVTDTLKNDPSTSHVPIVLLTARASVESKLEGLRYGADAYLTKPFRADELMAHIENLLASRKRLQEHFQRSAQQETLSKSAVASFSQQESDFLARLIQVVEENLDNEAMDADAFARSVFISRSQLHRKIRSLTGLSLSEFVRNHRLDRAKTMLANRDGSVAEIAWKTGFPNAKYFSTCFRERFGVAPSKFASEN